MDGFVEMRGIDDRGDAVVKLVIGEDCAKKLLLSLDVVGDGYGLVVLRLPDACNLVHSCPRRLFLSGFAR